MASDWNPNYPDIGCFLSRPSDVGYDGCSVTVDMVKFLNLTGPNFKPYMDAYCLHPPADDDCPFGYCPNPDIAGLLVRLANYIIGFCLTILVFYSPDRVKDVFWTQTLITYSLFVTGGIYLIREELTRFHSIVIISIVCSPVNIYFTGYSIRAFWGPHRLDAVLGKKQHFQRLIVFVSVAIWFANLVHAYLPQRYTKFSQDSCRGTSVAEAFFLGAPFVYAQQWAFGDGTTSGVFVWYIFIGIPAVIAFIWLHIIFKRRREIWTPGQPYRPRFGKVWRMVVTDYPFLRFWSTVVIPTAYWIGVIELGVLAENDDPFSLTFGQVLAFSAALPPFFQVLCLASDLWQWATDLLLARLEFLSWARMIDLPWVWMIKWAGIRFHNRRSGLNVPNPEETGTPNDDLTNKTVENQPEIV